MRPLLADTVTDNRMGGGGQSDDRDPKMMVVTETIRVQS